MSGSLLIDANSVGFASHNGTKLSAGDVETQAIFGMLRSVRNLVIERSGHRPILLWDGESWRKSASAEYKANRDDDPKAREMREAYKRQRPFMFKAMKAIGVTQVVAKNMEADDLAAIMTDRLVAKGENVVLVSGDKDWLQLVQPRVLWHDPIRVRDCSYRNFETTTGYANPRAFVEGKALQGDTSDNIKGVGGIGEKGAAKLLAEWGSVAAFVKAYRAGEVAKPGKRLKEFAENTNGGLQKFAENLKLMDLRSKHRPAPEGLKVIRSPIDLNAFGQLCGELAFHSILRDLDAWIKPFALLHKIERHAA